MSFLELPKPIYKDTRQRVRAADGSGISNGFGPVGLKKAPFAFSVGCGAATDNQDSEHRIPKTRLRRI
jgi:hypothetical protein